MFISVPRGLVNAKYANLILALHKKTVLRSGQPEQFRKIDNKRAETRIKRQHVFKEIS